MDNWPAAARLLVVAAAGQLPTAAPSHSERFSIGESVQFSVGIDTKNGAHGLGGFQYLVVTQMRVLQRRLRVVVAE